MYMKKSIVTLVFVSLWIVSCAPKKAETTTEITKEFTAIGATISATDAKAAQEMLVTFTTMNVGDTVATKFSATISEVCAKKGCWMTLPLGDSIDTRVTFKDYAFFMPLDAAGQDVIVDGIAFVNETSVADLKHFAQDAGKSQEEIDAIKEPKISYSFEAKGVLLKNN